MKKFDFILFFFFSISFFLSIFIIKGLNPYIFYHFSSFSLRFLLLFYSSYFFLQKHFSNLTILSFSLRNSTLKMHLQRYALHFELMLLILDLPFQQRYEIIYLLLHFIFIYYYYYYLFIYLFIFFFIFHFFIFLLCTPISRQLAHPIGLPLQ
jgi:hypothetical protein